jgi:hypothetical protein
MPRVTQVSLRVDNQIGTLARVCRDLATGGVNLLALSAPEGSASQEGLLRLIVANRDIATTALTRAGYQYAMDEVLFVELKNRPGALARAVEKLAKARIDIRYAYATAYPRAQKTAAVIAVVPEEMDRASRLLGR